jgi:hypothetical protein
MKDAAQCISTHWTFREAKRRPLPCLPSDQFATRGGWRDPHTAIAYREALDAFVADSNPDALPARLRPAWRRATEARATRITSSTTGTYEVAATLIRQLHWSPVSIVAALRFANIAVAKTKLRNGDDQASGQTAHRS